MRYDLWQGDRDVLQVQLEGTDPLPDGTTVTFTMAQSNGSKRIQADGNIDDPVKRIVSYQFAAEDSEVAGVFRSNFRITLPGNLPDTYPEDEPIYVVVHAAL